MANELLIYSHIEQTSTFSINDSTMASTPTTVELTSEMLLPATRLATNKSLSPFDITTKNSTLDITENDFRRFIEFMQMYNTAHECADYCKGEFYQMLRAYNGIHGYVALMVSAFSIKTVESQ